MFDIIEKLGNCTIHHGKSNNRIYLMDYNSKDENIIIDRIEDLAEKEEYSKIVLKIPENAIQQFLERAYHIEGQIPRYFMGKENCIFLSKFLLPERGKSDKEHIYKKNIDIARTKLQVLPESLHSNFTLQKMDEKRAPEMVALYKKVFLSYPFPIFDTHYIIDTMKDNIAYFGIYYNKELIALSSSEISYKYKNAEMTDFAINPEYRGKGLAKHLLNTMEKEMKNQGIQTVYSIARSLSLPMNCTFSSVGYKYGGTLLNNTQISGQIESMNIWYKN
ncbi:beta-lysine acetyltransferase [Alkalibaculum bacchi]|uniref:Beta-lysine acetyltransferase n=1 Tax=Alkalibaculum bacchi TaxID=645887 RepID=A0A366IAG5_9FIRM|nr:putative beta-lysine N-acetyltransferase [Alkalibaculum bacchi]RBP65350.1 beta-lysine acetyltransferase [Alkalibaculum bacchi]